MKKKSQIKMVETISILVIFFILLLFGFMFYSQFQKRSLLIQQQEFTAKNAVVKSLKTVYLNEFRCEHTEQSGRCIDLVKFEKFKDKLATNEDIRAYYSDLFSTSHIYYVDVLTGKNETLYDGSVADYSKTSVQTPILLSDVNHTINGERVIWNSFGVLHVDYYYS
jgi:hypothetical protein